MVSGKLFLQYRVLILQPELYTVDKFLVDKEKLIRYLDSVNPMPILKSATRSYAQLV